MVGATLEDTYVVVWDAPRFLEASLINAHMIDFGQYSYTIIHGN